MEALLLGLLPQTGQREVEYAVEEDHDQDQHVAVVSRLVHCHNEAEPLHKQSQDQEASHDQGQGRSAHPERLEHEVAHVVLGATIETSCVDRVVPRGLSLHCSVLAIVKGHIIVASIMAVPAVAALAASVWHPIVYLVFNQHLVQVVELAGGWRHFLLLLLERLVLNLLR